MVVYNGITLNELLEKLQTIQNSNDGLDVCLTLRADGHGSLNIFRDNGCSTFLFNDTRRLEIIIKNQLSM